ncbi:hypothetical protein KCU73_g2608, partial [Aureobasidium melanogenum]
MLFLALSGATSVESTLEKDVVHLELWADKSARLSKCLHQLPESIASCVLDNILQAVMAKSNTPSFFTKLPAQPRIVKPTIWFKTERQPRTENIKLLFSVLQRSAVSQRKHMAQLEGKSDGASLTLVPQSAARLSLVRSDGNSNPIAPDLYLDPSMTSVSLSLSLLADAKAFGIHDAVDMTHDSQPALKSYMKVDDQLRALSVTQPSLKRIFRSNQPLAILSSYLDSVDRQHVILKLAAFNNFTTLNAYLSGNATHNKKISQFFDLVDAGPASTFCTLYSLCLGHLSVEPTQSNLEKKLVPGTNSKAKDGQELVKPQKTQLIRDVNGEYKLVPRQMLLAAGGEGQLTQARDAVSAEEEQIRCLEQDIAELSADKDAVIEKLELQLDQKEENDEKVNDFKRALDDANKRNA